VVLTCGQLQVALFLLLPDLVLVLLSG
jgi:hypothetical protein